MGVQFKLHDTGSARWVAGPDWSRGGVGHRKTAGTEAQCYENLYCSWFKTIVAYQYAYSILGCNGEDDPRIEWFGMHRKLEEVSPPKKGIISSRSFGIKVTDLASQEESVLLYVARAAEKMRRQSSYAGEVHVFINTSRFNEPKENYANSIWISLNTNSQHDCVNQSCIMGLRKIYRRGYKYQKAGGCCPAWSQRKIANPICSGSLR